jgi:two-component system, cell cycle sensor histidine kinase and response regulator CckA
MNTILVVDDEDGVRETITKVLASELDVNVLGAADGYEALRVIVEHPVELMITDIQMSGLSGFHLARQAKLIRPTMHVIYLSAFYWLGADGPIYGSMIHKPFRAAELIKEVARELAAA